MKKLILTAILVVLAGTKVFAYELASFQKGIRLDGNEYKVINASLSDDGDLFVALTDLFPTQDIALVAQSTISKHNLQRLKNLVIELSNATIVKRHSEIVCKMMASPEAYTDHLSVLRGYDAETGGFSGALELVQGPSGCYLADKVYLEKEHQNDVARILKLLMETLAVEALGNQLN